MCVDDFLKYTWVDSLQEKSYSFTIFESLCQRLQHDKGKEIGNIVRIHSEHGREFENFIFFEFCSSKGIAHEFSAPITLQQNGFVQHKYKTLHEMDKTMLHAKNIPYHFRKEAIKIVR